jgi:hypothetical protein
MEGQGAGIAAIIQLLLRIVGVLVCVNKAKSLNRSTTGWGILGFVFPVIAMIVIQFKKPIIQWDENINIDQK